VTETVQSYFRGGGAEQAHAKDLRRAIYAAGQEPPARQDAPALPPLFDPQQKLLALDVGSCYNPFANVADLNVVPIDIAPATPAVLRCDFLTAAIGSSGSGER
jgi:hypothetical protein